ncbi:Hypothetical predicted protein [Xyrichtys novacula]|uniref:Uncharacterized protein n=1 Tax=Xyrichtys novacula TaxID=13765 RepID=A0AAV1FG31_XYRNO|nr:Hypothetical predicted protein [Xyrichtys novacula]
MYGRSSLAVAGYTVTRTDLHRPMMQKQPGRSLGRIAAVAAAAAPQKRGGGGGGGGRTTAAAVGGQGGGEGGRGERRRPRGGGQGGPGGAGAGAGDAGGGRTQTRAGNTGSETKPGSVGGPALPGHPAGWFSDVGEGPGVAAWVAGGPGEVASGGPPGQPAPPSLWRCYTTATGPGSRKAAATSTIICPACPRWPLRPRTRGGRPLGLTDRPQRPDPRGGGGGGGRRRRRRRGVGRGEQQ